MSDGDESGSTTKMEMVKPGRGSSLFFARIRGLFRWIGWDALIEKERTQGEEWGFLD